MKLTLLTGICVLLNAIATLAAEPLANAVFSVGTTTTNAQGAQWAYLLWQPTEPNALAGRKIAVYSKTGAADAAGNYTRKAVTQRQTDPLVIQSLLSRAVNVGDNLAELETRVNAMFAAAVPRPNLTLAEKISAIIRGAGNDPKLLANVVFLGRLHPSLNMCLGHAWAEPVTPGKTTFELRDFDIASNSDNGVIGRVTVDPAAPIVLPPPGMPVQYNEVSAKGDLNIKLRWATPMPLRELGLLQHGYNVYRMPKNLAESLNFHVAPPSRSNIVALLASGQLKKINETPITVNKLHDALSALNFQDDPTWYLADDNGRYKPGGIAFINGQQFYYFVTARDLLGRDGHVSAGGLAMACDRVPPDAPEGIQVENHYTFNPVTLTSNQVLKIKWKQAPNTGDVVTAYYIYRWTNATIASQVGPTNPVLNRIAGPLAHVPGQAYGSYIDNGPGSPHAPDDYNKTYWYTVRAADAGVCTNNLSPNSAPAFGVLRDRTAPGVPVGDIGILCCRPFARSDKDQFTSDPTATDTNLAYYRFTITRTNMGLGFAEIFYTSGNQTNLIAREPFSADKHPLVINWAVARAEVGGGNHRTFCRIVGADDKVSVMIEGSNDPLPPANSRHDVNFFAWLNCGRVLLRPGPLGDDDCDQHTPVNPDDGTIEPPIVVFLPPATSKEFRLYRRINGGPMTLIKQGPITNDPPVNINCPDPNPPANAAVLCYYVQCLDEHGNAGPLTQINDCFNFKLPNPKPLLSPLEAAGDENNPKMTISWFCPPFGVERFEIYISPQGGGTMPTNIAPNLVNQPAGQTVYKWVKIGKSPFWVNRPFFVYRTPRVGPQFGDDGFYQVDVDIELNKNYHVFIKPVGLDGQPDPDSQNSKVESFLWNVPVVKGPQVPWPARPLPNVSTNAFPGWVRPTFINNTNVTTNFVGVGIVVGVTGKAGHERPTLGQAAAIDGNDNPLNWIVKSSTDDSLFPCVVYRYQETNSFFPGKVSGDIVQVTPMMDQIAYTVGNDAQFGQSALIYDPFIDIYSASKLNIPELDLGGVARNVLVLLDTQPVLFGARYRYLVVRFAGNGEIAEVIPTAPVEIQ
jgi:hypothetical protein